MRFLNKNRMLHAIILNIAPMSFIADKIVMDKVDLR